MSNKIKLVLNLPILMLLNILYSQASLWSLDLGLIPYCKILKAEGWVLFKEKI